MQLPHANYNLRWMVLIGGMTILLFSFLVTA